MTALTCRVISGWIAANLDEWHLCRFFFIPVTSITCPHPQKKKSLGLKLGDLRSEPMSPHNPEFSERSSCVIILYGCICRSGLLLSVNLKAAVVSVPSVAETVEPHPSPLTPHLCHIFRSLLFRGRLVDFRFNADPTHCLWSWKPRYIN